MSQLTLSLPVTDNAQRAMKELVDDATLRAVAIVIDSESFVPKGNAIPLTNSLDSDLAALRSVVADSGCAFAFVRVGGGFQQVMIVPDAQPTKSRMLYASSNAHLRKSFPGAVAGDHHVASLDALSPSLFESQSNDDVMTDSEKAQRIIAQMPVAPQGSALPGVALKLDEGAEAAIKAFGQGDSRAAAFAVSDGTATCVWTSTADPVPAIQQELGDAHPRFILLRWDGDKPLFIYLCPTTSKPRDRMAYSVSKLAFAAQLTRCGIDVARSIETDETAALNTTITDALQGGVNMAAIAPAASTMVKGPRMVFQ